MGKLRTIVAWLGVSTVGLVSGLPHVTLADDAGPGKEVRAIRHDLPVLVSGSLWSPAVGPHIDAVAVAGNQAVAEWHDQTQHRIDRLAKQYGRWWLTQSQVIENGRVQGCIFGPTPSFLASSFGLTEEAVRVASKTLPSVIAADAAATPTPQFAGNLVKPSCNFGSRYDVPNLVFSNTVQRPLHMSGYEMDVLLARNDALQGSVIADFQGRPPTEAESWVTFGGNSYYFFSGTVQSPAPIHVESGTTIDVWFPFVLDSSLFYGLTIAHADKPIGPIDGTLKHNVVRFVLPAFTVPPGATLMGEIEGDSFRHE